MNSCWEHTCGGARHVETTNFKGLGVSTNTWCNRKKGEDAEADKRMSIDGRKTISPASIFMTS